MKIVRLCTKLNKGGLLGYKKAFKRIFAHFRSFRAWRGNLTGF